MANDTEEITPQSVPVNDSLDALYPSDALLTQGQRWDALCSRFKSLYGHAPNFVARSPGRVNIIGEHIDYSLYAVLPMGIAADVIIAVSASPADSSGAKITLNNINSAKFQHREFTLTKDGSVSIDASTHEWTNYFKAGLSGAIPLLRKSDPSFRPHNLFVLVDGTVPAGGGLSSSAAFVSTSALACLYAHGHVPSKQELVELAIVAERSVGVNSGGMDQAASVFSIRGDALHVSFTPALNAQAVPFPKTKSHPLTFMIAQSFVAADKHVTAPVCYNLRVVECTLAAAYLAAALGLPKLPDDPSPLKQSLHGFEEAYFASSCPPKDQDFSAPEVRLKHMLQLVETYLSDKQGYDRETVAEMLGMSVADLEERYMSTFPVRATHFKLGDRAQHVFSESLRVHQFLDLMKAPPTASSETEEELLHRMGTLMNQTQDSCRELYECSCAELDELCQIARRAGSYGSRLTGAGWGGCSVHLVPKDKVDAIRETWEKEYYRKKFPDISGEKLAEAVVVSEPGHGAMIIKME